MLKEEGKIFLKFVLIPICLLMFFYIFLLNMFFSAAELVFSANEFLLISFGIFYTTYLTKKYQNEFHRKQLKTTGKSEFFSEIKVFLWNLFIMFLIAYIFLMFFYILDSNNVLGNTNGLGEIYLLEWNNLNKFGLYNYYLIFSVILMVLYFKLINYLITDSKIVNVIGILIIVHFLFFANFLSSYIRPWPFKQPEFESDPDAGKYITIGKTGLNLYTNIFVFPWYSLSMFGKPVLTSTYSMINFFDFKYISQKFVKWYPYFTMILMIIGLNCLYLKNHLKTK